MPDQPARPASKASASKRAPTKRAPTKRPAAKAARKPAPNPGAKAAFAGSKADPALLAKVEALLPEFPLYARKMFGVTAWFVEANAQMLGCVWGEGLNLRVGVEDARALIASGKAGPFDPMGRGGMREYVLVPASTLRPAQLRRWVERALAFTETVERKKGK